MSDTIHILVAEDDDNIREGLVDTLESEGYGVTAAKDGNEALALFSDTSFDMILLDIMMPGVSGYDVCREIRKRDEDVPVVMLTAKGEELDKVVGLQLGADDYITKPFGIHELLARIAAILRRVKRNRSHESDSGSGFSFGAVTVDRRSYRIIRGDETLDISDRELKLLLFFHAHPEEVLSRDQILNAVWGVGYFGTTRTLDQHIAMLRKKVEQDPAKPVVIKTVHGVGYRYSQSG